MRLAEYRRPPETRELLEEALGLLRAAGDPKSAGPAWLGMARVLARAGDQPGTLEALVKARTFFEMVGDEERVAEVAALEDAAADGRWQP